MAARYFIVGETGDAGAWLVDVEAGTVARINADDLAAGKDVPDGDLVANLVEMRLDRNFTIFQGVSLAVAAESLAGPSAHTRPIPSIAPSHRATAKLSE